MSNEKTFPVFESNQILTSTQLNGLRDFLFEEEKRSRVNLSGIGIVQGLEISYNNGVLEISKGYGVTSDGYLIEFEGGKFKYYGNYVKENGFPEDTLAHPLELSNDSGKTLLNEEVIMNKVVLLYLKLDMEDLKSCTGSSCDNKGKKATYSVVPLLADKKDVTIEQSVPIFHATNVLPLTIFKGILNNGKLHPEYQAIISGIKDIINKLNEFYIKYGTEFSIKEYNDPDPINLGGISSIPIQYIYDFYKDIEETYYELMNTVEDLMPYSGYSDNAFPTYLMLGCIGEEKYAEKYRHYFQNTPVFNQYERQINKVQILFKRAVLMSENFGAYSKEIKITPSGNLTSPLGKKAIPFYFFDPNGKVNEDILACWNPDLTLKNRHYENLWYHHDLSMSWVKGKEYLVNPIKYQLDKHTYFRIEGHVGQELFKTGEQLSYLRYNYNLPFEILPINVSGVIGDIDEIIQADILTAINNISKNNAEATINSDPIDPNFIKFWNSVKGPKEEMPSQFIIQDLQNIWEKIATLKNNGSISGYSLIGHSSDEDVIQKDCSIGDLQVIYSHCLEDFNSRLILSGLPAKYFYWWFLLSESIPKSVVELDAKAIYSLYLQTLILNLLPLDNFYRSYYGLELPLETFYIEILSDLSKPRIMVSDFYLDQKFGKFASDLNLKNAFAAILPLTKINVSVNNTIYSKLSNIFITIQNRLLQKQKNSIFSNFKKVNPGAVHIGGVEKGGTFFLLYEENEHKEKIIIGDMALSYRCNPSCFINPSDLEPDSSYEN